ncbi:MAG: O-methyltransferase [Lachnospiraceae bacterium]|nr:O-methyltransferase [Lachnospiraceae bacterium]
MKYRYDGQVTDERMDVYLETLASSVPEYLMEIANQAHEEHVPIMRRQTGEILRYMIRSCNIKSILEVGTAIGYSALYMASLDDNICIDTVEKVPARIESAKKNFKQYSQGQRINLLEGDAAEVLKKLQNEKRLYDMVFLDAAKAQYSIYMEHIYELLESGGLVITDNVLQEGELLNSRYAVNRRDRTIHSRMREFLYEITHSDKWETVVLPIGDGIAMSTRR